MTERFSQIAGNATDVDLAVNSAQSALDGEWGRMIPAERGRLLYSLAGH